MKSERIEVAGMKAHFFRAGAGDPLVILHGWNPQIDLEKSYGALVKKLAENREVIVIGLPGFAGSDFPPREGWHTENYAEWLEEFLQKLSLKNPTLYGHSFGCRVLVRFLRRNPHFGGKIILTGAAGIRWSPERGRQKFLCTINRKVPHFKRHFRKICPKLCRRFVLGKLLGAYDWAMVPPLLEKTLQKTLAEPDFRTELPKIEQEILLVWGGEDHVTPVKSAYVFAEKLPHATLKIIPEARHGLHYTHPDAVAKRVKTFLGKA